MEEITERLDVAELRAEGALPPGASWVFCGQEALCVEWTGCNLGGSQPWLVCPMCGRRRRTLYLHWRYGAEALEAADAVGAAYHAPPADQHVCFLQAGADAPRTFARLFGEAEALESEVMDDVRRSIEDAEAKLLLVAARLRSAGQRSR